jgi:hypothetical protein
VKEAYKEHEKEFRRSVEISTGFYEKLSALDAGSIAAAVSIGIALIVRSQLQPGSLHAIAHWLVVIVFSLWLSLVCAVIHNYAVVDIAKLEAAYSEDEFTRTIVRRSLAMVRGDSAEHESLIDQLEERAQQEPRQQQQHNVKRRQTQHRCVTILGYFSMGSFLAAYTLVMVCVVRLWWITP